MPPNSGTATWQLENWPGLQFDMQNTVPSIAGKTVSPQLLRHACAIHTLEATGDVRKVSLWLGHSSLQTTEMYLRADPTDKLNTLHKWRPPSLRKGRFKGVPNKETNSIVGIRG